MTAEEKWNEIYFNYKGDENGVLEAMKQFAKYHVKEALLKASKQVKTTPVYRPNCDDHTPFWGACVTCGRTDNPDILIGEKIDEESILSAYSEENIK